LNHLLSPGSIAKEEQRKAQKGMLMALHQVGKSELVAGANALE